MCYWHLCHICLWWFHGFVNISILFHFPFAFWNTGAISLLMLVLFELLYFYKRLWNLSVMPLTLCFIRLIWIFEAFVVPCEFESFFAPFMQKFFGNFDGNSLNLQITWSVHIFNRINSTNHEHGIIFHYSLSYLVWFLSVKFLV